MMLAIAAGVATVARGSMGSENHRQTLRIGLDVGGTFTDLFLYDDATGRSFRHKLPSTPQDPYRAPILGIRQILDMAGAEPARVKFVGLGTTVATNALLERKGAPTGLITTRGFRDVHEIARQKRPHPYDLRVRRPEPLVARALRQEVDERIAADGSIVLPLDESSVEQAVAQLVGQGVQSVAVCLLNSYRNPAHEMRVLEIIRAGWPELAVTASCELVPEFREYERMSSTVVNAYLMPTMQRYLQAFSAEAEALRIPQPPFVVTSSGGIVTPRLAAQRPIDTLLSGPSGGVGYAAYLSRQCGYENLITFDMGGTSTDVCLIRQGRPMLTRSRVIDGLPMQGTAVDVHTVGAGGSSIAWIDAGGLLRVGPASAGARPGPACYGNPGARPTVTDANVVLGRLNQKALLAGSLPIDASLSARAIEETVAAGKALGVHEAAAAVLTVSNTHIAQAIRFVSVERGLDPRQFMLVAFGGAGPLHAADVARELDMAVLVPPGPGVLCAMGVLTRDIELDASRTLLVRAAAPGAAQQAAAVYADLESRLRERFAQHGIDAGGLVLERSIDARYVGQSFEIGVAAGAGEMSDGALQQIRKAFDAAHAELYGYAKPEEAVEFVTFRLRAMLPTAKPDLAGAGACEAAPAMPEPVASRPNFFEAAGGWVDCPVFERKALACGARFQGPAIVEQMDTTTVIPPDFEADVDRWGNLVLRCVRKETS